MYPDVNTPQAGAGFNSDLSRPQAESVIIYEKNHFMIKKGEKMMILRN